MGVPGNVSPGAKVKSGWANDVVSQLVPSVWTPVTYQNGWVDYGAGLQPLQYRKLGDIVYIRGITKNGPVPSVVFTLPAGFRPPTDLSIATMSNQAFGYFVIGASGAVTASAGNTAYMWMNTYCSTI